MDREFKRWMKWYGKKHGEYTVSWCQASGNALHFCDRVLVNISGQHMLCVHTCTFSMHGGVVLHEPNHNSKKQKHIHI